MKLALALVVLFVAVAAGYRSGYDCRRYCDHTYKPVCSTEGSTYDNECMLKCDWSYKACDGRCPCYQYRPRPVYHRPIVGYDYAPVSYYEPTVISYEPPSAPSYDCHCSKDKDYVCTYDNETYDNECEARCDGKVKACDGPCPCGYKK